MRINSYNITRVYARLKHCSSNSSICTLESNVNLSTLMVLPAMWSIKIRPCSDQSSLLLGVDENAWQLAAKRCLLQRLFKADRARILIESYEQLEFFPTIASDWGRGRAKRTTGSPSTASVVFGLHKIKKLSVTAMKYAIGNMAIFKE